MLTETPAWFSAYCVVYPSDACFGNARFEIESGALWHGDYQFLHILLHGVEPTECQDLPPKESLTAGVIRHYRMPLPGATFPCALRLDIDGERFRSSAELSAVLSLEHADDGMRERQRRAEVEGAAQRTLLDAGARQHAMNRIGNRPIMQKLQSLRDAQYVPENEWQLDVMFCRWVRERDGQYVNTPLTPQDQRLGDCVDRVSLRIEKAEVAYSGFRVSSFSSVRATSRAGRW